jgi:UDP-N-acetylglucosamine--N-acetylmuramyl-(pentapeptide) pyrophosphoryl-undecaprenol N-acetylglucosamine transferase
MIAAGGTGGHVYPALSIAQALKKQHPEAEFTFVGSVGGFERPLIEASDVPFVAYDEVRAGPLAGVSLPRKLWSLIQLAIGLVQAVIIMVRRRPRALLMTGGWVSFPTGVAA